MRGARPRYWEDVREGDALPTMAKGPMTVTGFIAYAQGWGGLYIRANKLAWKQIQRHSGPRASRTASASPTVPSACTGRRSSRSMVGAPGAYDYGPERCSWLTHHLTNWMGDDGFLRRAHCKIRRHNPEGDTLCIDGTVMGKRVEDGRHLVEIEQEARNQDGELSVVGRRRGRAAGGAVTAIGVHPIAGALGAEISGVDLSRDPGDETRGGDPPRLARAPRHLLPRPAPVARRSSSPSAGASASRSSTRS